MNIQTYHTYCSLFIMQLIYYPQQQRFATAINRFVTLSFELHLLWTCSAFGVSLSETSVWPDFALSLRNDVGLGDFVRWINCSILSPALDWNEFDFHFGDIMKTPNILSVSGSVYSFCINPLSANPTKSSNTLKQFVGKLPTNCLSVFDHFVILALKGLRTLDSS